MGGSKVISDYFKFRKERKRVRKLMEMDSSTILRDFILDTRLLEAQQVSTLLGLPEITQEAIDKSKERGRRIDHLFPIIVFLAATFSTGVMNYYSVVNSDLNSDEENRAIEAWVTKVSTSCMLGLLSQLEALDLIEVKE